MASRLRIRLLLSLLALALVACAPAASTPSGSIPASASPPSSAPSVAPHTVYPLTLRDDAGRQVTIAAAPTRIVSLAPSNTEILCAIGACDELVGVTDFDDYPAQVKDVTHVVVGAVVDVEKVVAAQPQLILAAGNELTPTAVIDQLTKLGYPVLSLYPHDLDGVYQDVSLVGAAIDAQGHAGVLVASMKARADAVSTAVAGAAAPRTFYEVGVFEGSIYTAGRDSFLASLISIAGGDPITGDPASTAIQLEDLIAADPQLILLGDAAYDSSITAASVAARQGWGDMTAVKDGRIVVMLDDEVITRPGPRIVDGLEALARAIHPETAP
ncbi:MAG TPA: helical backbone metal receptor, partial [Candidatus Limnocylindria bacterium]|jgi:iron complex transport system substrate-binding protein